MDDRPNEGDAAPTYEDPQWDWRRWAYDTDAVLKSVPEDLGITADEINWSFGER